MTNAELISMVRSIAKHGADWRINEVLNRAADALEADEKRIDGLQKLVDINTERCEALRKQLRESHESYEKRIEELEKQEPTEKQVVDYCHKRCLVIVEEELFHRMKSTFSQLPKEGEWIPVDDGMVYVKCSVCGDVMCCRGHYCPNCGAKMDGERKDGERDGRTY